jgi:beta-1,4-mannosyltransferase
MKILVFPKDSNPYQELLYSPMIKGDMQISYLEAPFRSQTILMLLFIPLILYKRLSGYNIFHLHWMYGFSFPWGNNFWRSNIGRFVMGVYIAICVLFIRLCGMKLVWTVHNITPHEKQTSNDAFLARFIGKLSNAIIVHSRQTKNKLQEIKINTINAHVIPHGNYDNVYPNKLSRIKARNILGIKPDEKVVLFFGLIRYYKGVDNLLDAFLKLKQSNIKLVVVGKCDQRLLCEEINQKIKINKNLIFINSFIPKGDVQIYFKAADIACFPFRSITTSGSVMLALTFGKPIIAPNIGAIQELPKNIGMIYMPDTPNILEKTLRDFAVLPSEKISEMSKAARLCAEMYNWDYIAERTMEIYSSINQGKYNHAKK